MQVISIIVHSANIKMMWTAQDEDDGPGDILDEELQKQLNEMADYDSADEAEEPAAASHPPGEYPGCTCPAVVFASSSCCCMLCVTGCSKVQRYLSVGSYCSACCKSIRSNMHSCTTATWRGIDVMHAHKA